MASPESEGSFHETLTELERLVEIWKNLGNSYMSLESITDLITQKLVGLRVLDDNDIRGTSSKDLDRLVGIRNTIMVLNICSDRNYGEHWEILDALLKKMITVLSGLHPVDATSDLRCLETLEEWVALSFQMAEYPVTSPESSSFLDEVVVMRLEALWDTFNNNGFVVKDDASSIRVLEIATKLRVMLHPRFHMWIDKIIGQKLRILSIRQAGKSDPSLNDIVQFEQKASALPEAQDDVHQDSRTQDVESNKDNRDAAEAVSDVVTYNIDLNQQTVNAIAEVHYQHEEPSLHRSQSLDSQIKELKDSYAKIKEELCQKTEAYEERKAHAIALYNELVEERLSHLTMAMKINELKEEKETLTMELQKAKSIIERAKLDQRPQRFSNRSHEGAVTANEPKDDISASSSHVPSGLRHVLSPESLDDLRATELQDEKEGSVTSFGDVTPASSNGSMKL